MRAFAKLQFLSWREIGTFEDESLQLWSRFGTNEVHLKRVLDGATIIVMGRIGCPAGRALDGSSILKPGQTGRHAKQKPFVITSTTTEPNILCRVQLLAKG